MARLLHQNKKDVNSRTAIAGIVGLGILSAVIYLINFNIQDLLPVFSALPSIQLYVAMFLFLSALYLTAVFVVIKLMPLKETSWKLTGIIIILAILFRLCLIPSDPAVLSKDMYRYIWDGRVQHRGINPYLYPPQADELKNLRDNLIFPNINRKDYPTLYPAGADRLAASQRI